MIRKQNYGQVVVRQNEKGVTVKSMPYVAKATNFSLKICTLTQRFLNKQWLLLFTHEKYLDMALHDLGYLSP